MLLRRTLDREDIRFHPCWSGPWARWPTRSGTRTLAVSLWLSFLWLSFHSCDFVQFRWRVLFSCSVPNGPHLASPSLIILCMSTSIPSRLSDADLVAEVLRLARSARATMVAPVAHLAALDARRLYLGAACSSPFTS